MFNAYKKIKMSFGSSKDYSKAISSGPVRNIDNYVKLMYLQCVFHLEVILFIYLFEI